MGSYAPIGILRVTVLLPLTSTGGSHRSHLLCVSVHVSEHCLYLQITVSCCCSGALSVIGQRLIDAANHSISPVSMETRTGAHVHEGVGAFTPGLAAAAAFNLMSTPVTAVLLKALKDYSVIF